MIQLEIILSCATYCFTSLYFCLIHCSDFNLIKIKEEEGAKKKSIGQSAPPVFPHGIVYLQYPLILQVFECMIPSWTTLLYEAISVWLRPHWGLNSARLWSNWTTAQVCMCDLQASVSAEHVEDPCEPLRNMAGACAEVPDFFDSQLQQHYSGSYQQFLKVRCFIISIGTDRMQSRLKMLYKELNMLSYLFMI